MTTEHRSLAYRKKALPQRLTRPLLRWQQQRLWEAYARFFPPRPGQRVLDLGVNGSLERPELYFFEANHPYPESLVAAGLEEPGLFHGCFPDIVYVQLSRDGPLPFDDGEFDVVFSNAVVEHVGDRDRQRGFLAEVARVGKAAFVTTPNRWFPLELHTVLPLVHWLPTPWYRAVFRRLGFEFFSREENLNLLDRRALLSLVPPRVEAAVHRRRLLGFTANLLLVWRRSEPATGTVA